VVLYAWIAHVEVDLQAIEAQVQLEHIFHGCAGADSGLQSPGVGGREEIRGGGMGQAAQRQGQQQERTGGRRVRGWSLRIAVGEG